MNHPIIQFFESEKLIYKQVCCEDMALYIELEEYKVFHLETEDGTVFYVLEKYDEPGEGVELCPFCNNWIFDDAEPRRVITLN